MTTTHATGMSFRAAAEDDRQQAHGFRRLAQGYSGSVRDRMLALVSYYEQRARAADLCARRFERLAAKVADVVANG